MDKPNMEYKTSLNNPAARLHEILVEAHGEVSDARNKKSIKGIWAEVFDIEPTETRKLLMRVSALIDLTRKARDGVKGLKAVNHDIYLKPFDNIEQALSLINLDAKWHNFDRYLTEGTLIALSFCADTLSRESAEDGFVDIEEVKKIQDSVASLLEIVLDSKISQELKALIVMNLEHIREAILEFRFSGVEGLRRAFEANLGSIFTNRQKMEESKDKPIVKKYFEVLSQIEALISLASGAKKLAEPLLPLLLP